MVASLGGMLGSLSGPLCLGATSSSKCTLLGGALTGLMTLATITSSMASETFSNGSYPASPTTKFDEERSNVKFVPCPEKVVQIMDQFSTCPLTKKLWDEASKQGQFSIYCLKNDEIYRSPGTHILNREIYVDNKSSKSEMIESILLGLNTFKASDDLMHFEKNMCELDMNTYVKSVLFYNYKNVKESYDVSKHCSQIWLKNFEKTMAFAKEFEGKNAWKSFDDFFKYQEATHHTDLYRDRWQNVCIANEYPERSF